MKNNKMVLPVIIILLIIFLPLTVIGSYKSLSKGTSLENPSKEHKYNNKLFYYDSEGKLLGTYECTSSDCDDAQTEIDDEINDFYKKEIKMILVYLILIMFLLRIMIKSICIV